MWAFGVVESQVFADFGSGLRHVFTSLEIDLLIFDAAPQAFDEDVVAPRPLAIDRDEHLPKTFDFVGLGVILKF